MQKPAAWCVHDGATNEPSWCGGVPGHYCHDTYGQSGCSPCDKHLPATWGRGCSASRLPARATASATATPRSSRGGLLHIYPGCGGGRLHARAPVRARTAGVGIVVLERNEVPNLRRRLLLHQGAGDRVRTCAPRARTIMCEETSLT